MHTHLFACGKAGGFGSSREGLKGFHCCQPSVPSQERVILIGPMAAHLLTAGHSFIWDPERGAYVPTAVDMAEKLYACMWDYCKKLREDMVRLELWDRWGNARKQWHVGSWQCACRMPDDHEHCFVVVTVGAIVTTTTQCFHDHHSNASTQRFRDHQARTLPATYM